MEQAPFPDWNGGREVTEQVTEGTIKERRFRRETSVSL
jgi:hypothetical protein